MSDENTIIDAAEFAEDATNGFEDDIQTANLASSEKPIGVGMEFTVRMDGYTLDDFEEIVIQTAAKKLLDSVIGDNESGYIKISQTIEGRVRPTIDKAVDDALGKVTKDVMELPISTEIAGRKSEPIKLADYIAMFGRDFLTEKVNREGKPAGAWDQGQPRINGLIHNVLASNFKKEMEAATSAMLKEVRAEMATKFEAFIDEERERIATSLGYEIKRSR